MDKPTRPFPAWGYAFGLTLMATPVGLGLAVVVAFAGLLAADAARWMAGCRPLAERPWDDAVADAWLWAMLALAWGFSVAGWFWFSTCGC